MADINFVQKTLNTLLEIVEVEFKIPLGIAEIKFPATEIAKKWWKNKKSRFEVEEAIQRAEQKFIAHHGDEKVAQMLHELPLYSEVEFKQVIAGLLTHLSEEKIMWLAEVKLVKTWGNIVNAEEIRKALALYLPYLQHELNSIKEFREVISALTLERIDETTRRIESKLDQVLETHGSKDQKEEPDFWYIPHPYPMPPNFTGRVGERKMLTDWLNKDYEHRLFILRALGGFGKSALTWHWLTHDVDAKQYPKVVFWSFYEGDASFENFLRETLIYLGVINAISLNPRQQIERLFNLLQYHSILLILDGFERVLRAYGNMGAAYQGDELQKDNNDLQDTSRDCISLLTDVFL